MKVCDAIMGSGKSCATITYMNEHPDKRFIYITPYLDEAKRIKDACPELHFVEPSDRLSEFHFKKSEHTEALIREGRNITTTHQAFKNYSPDMLCQIREFGYMLFIDESVDMLESFDCHPDDMKAAIDAGIVNLNNGVYTLADIDYRGNIFRPIISIMQTKGLMRIDDDGDTMFFWVLPPDLITSFREVIVLTYLFPGQSMHHMFGANGIRYEYIGVKHCTDGKYRFCDGTGTTPEYVSRLHEKICIIDHDNMNSVGDRKTALSMAWYASERGSVDQLRKNIGNYFTNIWRSVPSSHRMCGTYKNAEAKLKGVGYSKSFVQFNARATNEYRGRYILAYAVNLYMNVGDKLFYKSRGIEPSDDMYALSTMVQWIWRSAIRDGNDVYLYLPSKRMRGILTDWIDTVSKGGTMIA